MKSSAITHTQKTNLGIQSQARLALMFYIGWPALLGVILGWTGAGAIGGQLPKHIAVLYWVFGMLLMRLSLEASTRLAALAIGTAPKLKIPLAMLCLLAIPLHVYISAPLTYLWQLGFLGQVPNTGISDVDGIFITTFEKYIGGLRASVVMALEWMIVNLVFDRIMNFPRFRHVTGYQPPTPAFAPLDNNTGSDAPSDIDMSASDSRFLKKIPKKLGVDVIAMSAEDHYVRVYTQLGNDLILYRFSDAMAEMPKDVGFQVHRSHWVRKSAITDFQKRKNGQALILNDTIEVPVSKRFIEVVKANGLEMTDSTSS